MEGLCIVLFDFEFNFIKDFDLIVDVLLLMGVGDSVMVIMLVIEDMCVVFGFEYVECIYYDVVIWYIGLFEEWMLSEDVLFEVEVNEVECCWIVGELLVKIELIEVV